MELSFSSEREDYDEDPTAGGAANAQRGKAAARPASHHDDDDEEAASPPPKKTTAAASSSKPLAPLLPLVPLKPVEAKKSTGWSLFGGGGSAKEEKKPTTTTATAAKSSVVSNTVTEAAGEIQAFDPADLERSLSRRSSTSLSTKRKRKARAQKPIAQPKDDLAPGAIGDMSDRGGKRTTLEALPKPAAAAPSSKAADFSNGSTANKSKLADLERKGGKGAFAPSGDLNFSSDEEEEDGGKRNPRAKKESKGDRKDGALGSEKSSSGARSSGHQADVAPLIQPVALDFVLRRWLVTLLGGIQLTWSAQSSDESMPGVPKSLQAYQLLLLVYPAVVCIVFNALRFHDVIEPIGVACLLAGVVTAAIHLALHLLHRHILTRRPGTATRVADSSKAPAVSAASRDNYELDLQRLVKAQAKRDGTLVKPPPPAKKKAPAEEEDDEDASLPPGAKRPAKPTAHDVDDDDDDGGLAPIDANTPISLGFFAPPVQRFIVGAAPRSLPRIFLHALVVGCLCAGATFFLDWRFTAWQYDSSSTGDLGGRGIAYLVFAWAGFVLSLYSANVRAPTAEPAQWSEGGWWGEAVYLPFGRVTYVAGVIVFNLAVRLIAEADHGAGAAHLTQTVLDVHAQVLYVYLFLPVLFAFGVLPPLDALVWWSVEQVHTIFFAVSPAASSTRSAFFLVTNTAAAFIVFVVWLHATHSAALLFALGFSFLLAWNILPLRIGASVPADPAEGLLSPDAPFPGFQTRGLNRLTAVTGVKVALATGVGVVAGVALAVSEKDFLQAIQVLHEADLAFDLVALVLAIALYLLSEVYSPYLLCAQFKNPFYKRLVLEASSPGAAAADGAAQAASAARRPLSHAAFAWCVRVFLVVYVAFHQDPDLFDHEVASARETRSDHGKLTLFAYSVLLLRAFNLIWSSHFAALQHLLLVIVVNLITGGVGGDAAHQWASWDWSVRFLVVGFVWERVRYDLAPKIWFYAVLTHSSFTMPKLAMRHPKVMKALCLLLVPYHLGVLVFSSLLAAPILPFLGSPILVLGFPRPQRTWRAIGGKFGMNVEAPAGSGDIGNGGKDTVFYQQQFPEIYRALQAALLNGSLTYAFSAGDFFLLRSEPYLIWASVLEKGLGHLVVQLKGLELQTTSCHTVEALRIDEVVDSILDKSNALPVRSPLGLSFGYEPRLTLAGVRSFSITKNVLTGIIDDFDNLRLESRAFLRCIMYQVKKRMGGGGVHALPAHWLKPTVSNYDLQQLDEAGVWPPAYAAHLFSGADAGGPLSGEDGALYKKICLSIYAVVETLGSDVVSSGGKRTPAHVINVFHGRIATSLYSDYLLVDTPDAQSLRQLTIDAYRLAVKSLYDCAALACLEILAEDTPDQFAEWQALLDEYESEWYIGVSAGNATWDRLVAQGTKKMFTVAKAPDEPNKYQSLTLEMSKMSLHLCTLSSTAIRSMWSSLALELFYFANDDDEQASRQAHPLLLRNLTLQSAEPPFGYCVASSLPTILNTQ